MYIYIYIGRDKIFSSSSIYVRKLRNRKKLSVKLSLYSPPTYDMIAIAYLNDQRDIIILT